MSEEKITRLREVFVKTAADLLVEQETRKSLRFEQSGAIGIMITHLMKTEDMLQDMCELGVSGARIRGISEEEIERFSKELEAVSKELRKNLGNKEFPKVLFLQSQFDLLARRIFKTVANVLSPKPLYEFSKMEAVPSISRNVFIVHGREDKPKLELGRMLEKLGFNVIILSEQPDKGRTLIEKLEEETIDIGYVFAILTPDDVGELAEYIAKEGKLKYRARQNVILELGYFVGKIGRNRVCCLYKGDVELPSDIHGVLFKKFNESVEECYKGILEELKAAGYDIRI